MEQVDERLRRRVEAAVDDRLAELDPAVADGGRDLGDEVAAPDGIDVYFDNVGYEHLEAAIACFNNYRAGRGARRGRGRRGGGVNGGT